jgi:hypothetical protein
LAGHALLYSAALVVGVWGLAHLVPTRAVVASFGAITLDNRRVLAMEWIAEAVTMLFVGVLVAAVTLLDPGGGSVAQLVYRMSAAALAAIGALTAVTGARTPVIWFKACPVVMSLAITLILIGSSL